MSSASGPRPTLNPNHRRRMSASLAVAAVAIASVLIGCGGGGGGGQSTSGSGRSYSFSASGRQLSISIDSTGRFTIFEKDSTGAPNGTAAQGSLAADGSFVATSTDSSISFSGQISSDGTTATGFVQQSGSNLYSFSAAVTTAGAATPAASPPGTYSGTTGTTSSLLSIDLTSHATAFVNANGTTGGGEGTLSSTGTFTSTDGGLVGVVSSTSTGVTFHVTKLNGSTVDTTVTLTKATRAKWTFLVFINAANNLEEFGPLNVNQMEKVGSTQDVNIVIQWKQATCSDCGTPAWTGTRRYFVTKDSDTNTIGSRLIQDLGQNIDMGDWNQLHNFVVWGQQNYPADHYALTIWNHGAGWRNVRSSRIPEVTRAVSIDDSTGHEIETWQLSQALSVTPKMDMVIFDASLMQMMEVAYEMKDSTGVIVGSPESPPGEGYVYDTFLTDLVQNPNMTAKTLGTQIVNRTMEAYGTAGDNTQSALDTSKLQNLATKIDAFAGSLLAHKADSATAMTNARNTADHSDHSDYADNKDLWDYADLIKSGTTATDLQSAATDVQTALTSALIAEGHGALHSHTHGLWIYVPAPGNYLSTYGNLAFARATRWPTWLVGQP